MQCFQKDPNLRVSARKLLKHPWIVNARRSDSVVPKKPTEYNEAVKSVQEWNEALKSPNAGSFRRVSRPMSSSPIPGQGHYEQPLTLKTPVKAPPALTKPRVNTEQYRSPDSTTDDNWDDDFASAISPTALQLPHLRPHDNFGGLLSSEKLKAYASIETVTEEANWDDEFEGELTVKSPLQAVKNDPLQTIRAYNPKSANNAQSQQVTSTKSPPSSGRKAKTPSASHSRKPLAKSSRALPPIMSYGEDAAEDYSDLIVMDDTAFNRRKASAAVSIVLGWNNARTNHLRVERFAFTEVIPSIRLGQHASIYAAREDRRQLETRASCLTTTFDEENTIVSRNPEICRE